MKIIGTIDKIQDNCEAFDMAWALFYFLSQNHEGMYSEKYRALSGLVEDYQLKNVPDIDMDNNNCCDYDMVVDIYHQINDENWEGYFTEFCRYMDNDWDKNSC